MGGIHRSATLRLEEGEATRLAWGRATDEAGVQSHIDEMELEETELEDHREPRDSTSNEDIADFAPFAMRGALPSIGRGVRQQADDYYVLGSPPQTESSSIHAATVNGDGRTQELVPCRSPFLEDIDDDEANDFEPVGELPSLPKLDFKPIILRERTLISIAIFYLGLIAGLGVLYYYENKARIFHIHATASRFTIRYLPSLIGTLSTLIFQSVLVNFARIVPYIVMATPVHPGDKCATARQTLLANYFPLFTVFDTIENRHFHLLVMASIRGYLNPLITPMKSTLIHKRVSDQDPDLWTISISGTSAKYLMFNYSVLLLIVLGLLVYLWGKRTGLKWDPVSFADQIMLLQGSNILEDFSGLEYWSGSFPKRFDGKKNRFCGLETERFRLGYWRHRPTNQYWHGIRKWPASNRSSSTRKVFDARPKTTLEVSREPLIRSPIYPTAASSPEPPQDNIPAGVSRAGLRSTGARQYRTTGDIPNIKDHSPEALAWWRTRCNEVLKKPNNCYRHVYFLVSDYPAMLVYLVVAGSAAFGIWTILTGRLETGFTFPLSDYSLSNFILIFLPTFWFGLINGYWYQIDAWYRQLQPYMGLRQPSPATENLLLGYPCDLPVLITLRALGAGHWRLALTSVMPLVQRVLPILAGSLLTVDTTTSKQHFHITIAATPLKAAVGILCAYLVLIPIVWPGPDRRLPILPGCIADSIVLFYDSTLVRKDAFLPRRMDEQRWHMKYRLCLDERRYGFGIYPGRYGAPHFGIDDVYGYHEDEKGLRFVVPLKPPMRLYRRWFKKVGVWPAKKLHIKRQSTLHKEESEALQRLQIHLQETVEGQAPPSQAAATVEEQAPATVEDQAPANVEEQAPANREASGVRT